VGGSCETQLTTPDLLDPTWKISRKREGRKKAEGAGEGLGKKLSNG